ncbi:MULTISPECIES: hypothetical protein [unclassified Streptomyces]|uniref:hypothetical protein n=1 Tax=unclassified Streptomyces TaxID=2593676 RepID=UPI00165511E0|nr:hypothetical protein [Streptomyces sp. CB02980]MCB8902073.1 hypothetical protein [Streptomyces sp. CB02980]
MENVWIQPDGNPDAGYTSEQLRRARACAEQDLQAIRAQLPARFGLGDVCAEIVDQSGTGASSVLDPLARQLGYATHTLERYVRVTRLTSPELRDRLVTTSVQVPWKCVTTACVADLEEQARRVGLLLRRLASAERAGWPAVLDASEYCRALGLADGTACTSDSPNEIAAQLDRKEVRQAVLAELTKSPAAVLGVLREPAVREMLRDREVARYVREQMRPVPDPDEELLQELLGSEERDPRADWTIRYFDLAHKCREILLLDPDDFLDVDDPDVWQSVESIRDSVVSWANRVLQKRPRTIRLLTGK